MTGTKAFCSVCNIWLNSSEQFLAHQSGKSHKKREQAAASGTNLVPTAPVTQVVRSKTLIRFVSSQESSSVVVSENSTQQASDRSTDQQVSIPAQSETVESATSKGETYFCDVCMVKLTSKSQADMHFAGSKHRRALAVKSGNYGNVKTEGVKRKLEDMCMVCNVPLRTKAVAEAHYAGSKHEKKLKLSQTIGVTQYPAVGDVSGSFVQPPAQIPSYPAFIAGALWPSQVPALPAGAPVPSSAGSAGQQYKLQPGSTFFCSFCHVSVNSQQQMDAHRQGSKHKSAVNGIVQQRKKPFTPRTPTDSSRFVSPSPPITPAAPNGPMTFRARQPMAYPTPYY